MGVIPQITHNHFVPRSNVKFYNGWGSAWVRVSALPLACLLQYANARVFMRVHLCVSAGGYRPMSNIFSLVLKTCQAILNSCYKSAKILVSQLTQPQKWMKNKINAFDIVIRSWYYKYLKINNTLILIIRSWCY